MDLTDWHVDERNLPLAITAGLTLILVLYIIGGAIYLAVNLTLDFRYLLRERKRVRDFDRRHHLGRWE